ncbi:MAG: hypothetical protein AVDCRST_MAG68-3420 [uncultured Gemmatimonadetes bacterium]|uniref:Uncharacterized protein n=1 Tax=uncultured Gemmatimonadota bacterium TaxID=203437 RepID=A0A6J4LPD2_9BACT|nr:MAG: hypothetical protein AVDCRST_MAG68-3420 [uncultured Gemmatimonadota bacterium]
MPKARARDPVRLPWPLSRQRLGLRLVRLAPAPAGGPPLLPLRAPSPRVRRRGKHRVIDPGRIPTHSTTPQGRRTGPDVMQLHGLTGRGVSSARQGRSRSAVASGLYRPLGVHPRSECEAALHRAAPPVRARVLALSCSQPPGPRIQLQGSCRFLCRREGVRVPQLRVFRAGRNAGLCEPRAAWLAELPQDRPLAHEAARVLGMRGRMSAAQDCRATPIVRRSHVSARESSSAATASRPVSSAASARSGAQTAAACANARAVRRLP